MPKFLESVPPGAYVGLDETTGATTIVVRHNGSTLDHIPWSPNALEIVTQTIHDFGFKAIEYDVAVAAQKYIDNAPSETPSAVRRVIIALKGEAPMEEASANTETKEKPTSVKKLRAAAKKPGKVTNGSGTVDKKAAAAKAKEIKKKMAKAKEPKKDGKKGSGSLIRELIMKGLDNEAILVEVRKQFPENNTKTGDVSWNRWKMRTDGVKVPEPVKKDKPAKKEKAAKKPAPKKKAAKKK